MKKSEETLEDFAISYPLDKLAPLEQILFLDIETTGFTSRTSYLYMIGCAYYQAGKWRTIQWMADDYAGCRNAPQYVKLRPFHGVHELTGQYRYIDIADLHQ